MLQIRYLWIGLLIWANFDYFFTLESKIFFNAGICEVSCVV